MKKKICMMCMVAIVATTGSAVMADSFGAGDNAFTIDFVTISKASNPTGGDGIVDNDYRMGVYEIINSQWSKFTNSLGSIAVTGDPKSAYDNSATYTDPNQPVNGVSWYEAAQFVNWLNTSTDNPAAYKFTGTQGHGATDADPYTLALWVSGDTGYDSSNPYRNSGAKYYIPTEDEWVKAAYWNGTEIQAYATNGGSAPDEWSPAGGPNSDGQAAGWNFGWAYPDNDSNTDEPWDVTAGYSPEELNGTYDMMGNASEWLESPYSGDYATTASRGRRGGLFDTTSVSDLGSSSSTSSFPNTEGGGIGFRVASDVPEPCSLGLLALGGLAVLRRRRAKA